MESATENLLSVLFVADFTIRTLQHLSVNFRASTRLKFLPSSFSAVGDK